MATIFSGTIQPSNSTDALFRAWTQFIDTSFTTLGWVNTTDTGQANLTTIAFPTLANTKQGYKIYRMNDTLQATSPVYIKIHFGSGTSNVSPFIWITIGTGSDGAGNITNIKFDGTTIPIGSNTNSAVATNSYISGESSRIEFGLFITPSTIRTMFLSIERTKDPSGADNGDGLLVAFNNSTTTVNYFLYVVLGAFPQPPKMSGLHYILSEQNPTAYGTDIGVGIPIPIKGIAQQPGVGIVIVRANDYVAESTFTMSIYGSIRTYQHLNLITASQPVGGLDTTSRICMRYD